MILFDYFLFIFWPLCSNKKGQNLKLNWLVIKSQTFNRNIVTDFIMFLKYREAIMKSVTIKLKITTKQLYSKWNRQVFLILFAVY
jgi:hypothetical protein